LSPGIFEACIDAAVVGIFTGYMFQGLAGCAAKGMDPRLDLQASNLVDRGCAAAPFNMQLGLALVGQRCLRARVAGSRGGQQHGIYLDNYHRVMLSA